METRHVFEQSWTKLEKVHAQNKPWFASKCIVRTHFRSRKGSDESLQTHQSRVNASRQKLRTLRLPFITLEDLENELEIMASIRGLPVEYT